MGDGDPVPFTARNRRMSSQRSRHVTPLPDELTLDSATIPTFHCPECRSSNVRLLEALSRDSYHDFYQCHDCEHVWPIVKDSLDNSHAH